MSDGGNSVPRITKAEHIGPQDTGDNIEAKRVANYYWQPATGDWSRVSEQFSLRLDDTADPILYLGDAVIGTATSAAAWRIRKIDTTNGADITWADGNASFDNVWNDRNSLTYS